MIYNFYRKMNSDNLDNVNPRTYEVSEQRGLTDTDLDDSVIDPFDTREIFDLIRDINDPEHPLTLEQLNVVTEEQVKEYGIGGFISKIFMWTNIFSDERKMKDFIKKFNDLMIRKLE